MTRWHRAAAVALCAAACTHEALGPPSRSPAPVLPSPATHHEVTLASLPPPYATPNADNPSRVVPPPPDAKLSLPAGFAISTYAEGDFARPRWLALAPNGDVLLADSQAGKLVLLRGIRADGTAAERFVFADGLTQPFGIAFSPGWLYVGCTNAVVRFAYIEGDVRARAAPQKIAELPGLGYNEHWTRNLLFSPDKQKLYVSIGSTSNNSVEENPERASIIEMRPDGSGRRIYASGTRNPIGLSWQPGTTQLWALVQERDELGDDLVPDYLTLVRDGGFYGWPYAYIGPHDDPSHTGGNRPDLVARTIEPDLLFQAHSAVMDLAFYDGSMFPADWRGDAIVTFHGSWNRSRRTGYEIVRVRFDRGRPRGGYDDFVTGWMVAPDRPEVWGRPVGLLVLADGSLLVVDDGGAKVWRITYRAP